MRSTPDTHKWKDYVSGDQTIPAGKFVEVGEKQCDAGLELYFGQGAGSNFETALGRLFLALKDTLGAAITNCKLRLCRKDSQSNKKDILCSFDTDNLAQNSTDRRGWQPLPHILAGVKEDSYLCLEIYNGNAAPITIDVDLTTMSMDITKNFLV